jgi:hypothetical protein
MLFTCPLVNVLKASASGTPQTKQINHQAAVKWVSMALRAQRRDSGSMMHLCIGLLQPALCPPLLEWRRQNDRAAKVSDLTYTSRGYLQSVNWAHLPGSSDLRLCASVTHLYCTLHTLSTSGTRRLNSSKQPQLPLAAAGWNERCGQQQVVYICSCAFVQNRAGLIHPAITALAHTAMQ